MSKFFRCTALLAGSLCVADAFAGVNQWTPIGPEGGYAQKIVYDKPASALVFAIAPAGFFRSTNAGATWQLVKGDFFGTPSDIAVDPTNPDHVYVGVSGAGVYASTDAGATLVPLAVFGNGPGQIIGGLEHLAIGADGRTMYGTMLTDVYYSADAGQTWEKRRQITPPMGALLTVIVDPHDVNTVYAAVQGTGSGVFVSHDAAQHWQSLSPAPVFDVITTLAIDPQNSQRLWAAAGTDVYVTEDGGAHWGTRLTAQVDTLTVDPANPLSIYVETIDGSLRHSSDGGNTWPAAAAVTPAGRVLSIAVDPSNGSHLLMGGTHGVAYSDDGAATASVRNSGFISSRVRAIAASPLADRVYFGSQLGGLSYVTAGADTMTPVNDASLETASDPKPNNGISAIAVAPGTPDFLLVSAQGVNWAKSTDGGDSFSRVHDALFASQAFALAAAPNAPGRILAGSFGQLLISNDSAASWQALPPAIPPSRMVTAIAFAPSAPAIAYFATDLGNGGTGTTDQLWRSENGGLGWSPLTLPADAGGISSLAVDARDANTIYVTSALGVLKSVDGGSTWKSLDVLSGRFPDALAADPRNAKILYVGTVNSDIARSIDGGESWETLRNGQQSPRWQIQSLAVDPNRPYILFAGTAGFGVQQLKIEPDLQLQASAPATPLGVSAPATFNYTVTNAGPYHATAVRLQLPIPANLTVSSVTGSGADCSTVAGTVTCTWNVLRSAQVATVAVNVVANAAGAGQLVANLSAMEADPVPANNVATSDALSVEKSDLSISVAQASASIATGGTASYNFTIANAGPSAASTVQLIFQPGAGLSVSSTTPSSGTCNIGGNGTATCTVSNLNAQATASVTIVVAAPNAGTIQSTASVVTAGVDPTNGNNGVTVTTSVSAPDSGGGGSGGSGGGKSGGGGGGESAIFAALLLCLLAARRLPRILARSLRRTAYVVQESHSLSIAHRLERFR